MTLRSTLIHVAALASAAAAGAAACSSSSSSSDTATTAEAGAGDASPVLTPGCGGCNCGAPAVTQGDTTPDQACAIASESSFGSSACSTFCGGLNDAGLRSYFCNVPPAYAAAFQSAQRDASADADIDAGKTCPTWTENVVVQCGYPCLGRRTAGIADPRPCDGAALGAVFANRAYLEAVSVHAFARLERELAFHRAPVALRGQARRARRDEIRHTAMTVRLARRFGTTASLPEPPTEAPARSLFEIARENAVEGCVREMYGAVMGLIEAATSSDADVRCSSQRIADDECRHAELAMTVAHWIAPQLTPRERAAVHDAVAEAIADHRARGDRSVVALLDARVWKGRLLTQAA